VLVLVLLVLVLVPSVARRPSSLVSFLVCFAAK
jgi:hypothetical protein